MNSKNDVVKLFELISKIIRHDVLNTLTSAQLYLELALERKDEKYVRKALSSIKKAIEMTKNVGSIENAIRNGELDCIDVRDVVEKVAEDFDNVSVRGSGKAIADDGLRLVVENIVQNAVLHSRTDRVDIVIEEKDACEIRIIDYGKGIPDNVKEKIFDEGFKYGDSGRTGLGLFIAKRMIERYGGEIWVEDNYPSGTIFVIRLSRC